MKQRGFAKLVCGIIALVMLNACGHQHKWTEATCTEPATCQECGETDGEALGHVWEAASCTEAETCSRCGETRGVALGHAWKEATCTAAKICSRCGAVEGEALGHTWEEATCTEPETCSRCGETRKEPLGHQWNSATCTEPQICRRCGETVGEPLGHTLEAWSVSSTSTCTKHGIETAVCSVCGETVERELELLEHTPGDWQIVEPATETAKGKRVRYCVVCGTELEQEDYSLTDEELRNLFISQCKWISYDSLSRTPGEYEGEKLTFSGYVLQVCSEASASWSYSEYRVATSGRYNNVVYMKIQNYGAPSRILEDDYITFYGTYDGLMSYTTVMGRKITIPSVTAKYVK